MASEELGIAYGSRQDTTNAELLEIARLSEEYGYSTFFTGESWGRDALTLLTFVACNTSSLKLGTGILPIYSRTPALIAQSIASLDSISGGRAVLGLGTSGKTVIENWHGVPFKKPIETTEEYVSIIRRALSGERLDYVTKDFALQGFRLNINPVQKEIPIYLASLGPRNLALTGKVADGWIPIWVHYGYLGMLKDEVEAGAASVGRTRDSVKVCPQILCYVVDRSQERERARDLIRRHIAYYVGGMGTYYYNLFCRYGYQSESDNVRKAWVRNDREKASRLISDEMVDGIAVTGDPNECKFQIERFRSCGADAPVVAFPHGMDQRSVVSTIRALGSI